MKGKHVNLLYLEREWLHGFPAEAGLQKFAHLTKADRQRVLRHHSEAAVRDRETWLRDEIDYLLGYYGIIEIAMMIGFVDELPTEFQEQHLPILADAAMRRYYEWNYPVEMPRRFRERLQLGIGRSVPGSPELEAAFHEFLELTRQVERDEDFESFLWALDGGWREDEDGACDIARVNKVLKDPNRLARAIQTPPDERSELEAALAGFCKFIQFCEGLDAIIEYLKGRGLVSVSEAMWLLHGYWFYQLRDRLGRDLAAAIRSLAKWRVKGNDKRVLAVRVSELHDLVERLSAPPMAGERRLSASHPAENASKQELTLLERSALQNLVVDLTKGAKLKKKSVTKEEEEEEAAE